MNIDILLGLIKERSLLLKTAIGFEFCISGESCDHSDREFGKIEYLKQSVLQLKKGLCFLCVSEKSSLDGIISKRYLGHWVDNNL